MKTTKIVSKIGGKTVIHDKERYKKFLEYLDKWEIIYQNKKRAPIPNSSLTLL